MKDITDAFNGPFKEQRDMGSNWMPVPDHKVNGFFVIHGEIRHKD